ncbi:MAG: AAA family ATPase [Bacteroidales bacterium]|nr:AAA family ATPase [Bacteroidales bacterium]
MKIIELFDEKLNPNWDYIWTLEPFKVCIGVNQNKEWHREMLEEHIQAVTMHMKDIIDGNCPDWIRQNIDDAHVNKLALMAAALCHDLGKATTTRWDEGLKQWKCKNHGAVGEKIVREFFFDEPNIYLREKVCWLVRHHMTMHHLAEKNVDEIIEEIKYLSSSYANFNDFAALYVCDCLGSDNLHNDDEGWVNEMAFAKECVNKYNTHAEEWQNEQFDRLILDGIPDVVVMCGIAGSGKTTYAEIMSEQNGYKILSRDSIREELGMVSKDKKFKGNKQQEDKVTEVFNERMLQYARNGVPFIIDNMNLQERYRKGYKELLKDYDLKWCCVYVEAPSLEENIKRRENQIASLEIERMLDRLEFPSQYEFDEVLLYKQTKMQKENECL